jgi:hypothetical protein
MQHEYTRRNANALFNLIEKRLDSIGILVDNDQLSRELKRPAQTTLSKMLAAGGFPDTEANAVLDAYNALCDAVGDLQMAMCMPFEMAEMERTHAEHEAGIAAGTICAHRGQKK